MTLGDTETTMRQRRQLADTAIGAGHPGRVGGGGRDQPGAAGARAGYRCLQPARQGVRRARPPRRGAGRLRERAGARRHQPHRRAQRGAAARPAGRRRRQPAATASRRRHRPPISSRRWARPATRASSTSGRRASWRRSRPAMRWSWCSTATCWWRASARCEIGQVEPRVGARLGKLMKGGNRYEAAITVVERRRGADHHPRDVRPPRQLRQGLASPAARPAGRLASDPTSGARALRYDDEGEESEELEEEPEEVEELDTSLPEFSAEPELEEELLEEP